MYAIKIFDKEYTKKIEVVGDFYSVWNVYWNYLNSAQNIEDEFYHLTTDISSGSFLNISKGRACFDYGNEVGNHLIKSKKNVNYIK